MVDHIPIDLLITPRSNPRKKFWKAVYTVLTIDNSSLLPYLNNKELKCIEILSNGIFWIDLIPSEWIDIYGALYDESKQFDIDTSVKHKIQKDIHRTFGLFHRNQSHSNSNLITNFNFGIQLRMKESEYHENLEKILLAASYERGYCQGINFIAALFLLTESSDKDAYILLCYLLRNHHLEILFNPKYSSLLEYMKIFEKKLRKHNKLVYKHLKENGFTNVCYALEWFTTCFIVSCPGNLAVYVMDLLFIGIHDILIRIGLAIMDAMQSIILDWNTEDLHMNFKKIVMTLDPMEVIPRALTINLETKRSILRTMILNIDKMSPMNHEFVDTLRTPRAVSVVGSDAETDSLSNDPLPTDMQSSGSNLNQIDSNESEGYYEKNLFDRYQSSLYRRPDVITSQQTSSSMSPLQFPAKTLGLRIPLIQTQDSSNQSQLQLQLQHRQTPFNMPRKIFSLRRSSSQPHKKSKIIRRKMNIKVSMDMINYLIQETLTPDLAFEDSEIALRQYILNRKGLNNKSGHNTLSVDNENDEIFLPRHRFSQHDTISSPYNKSIQTSSNGFVTALDGIFTWNSKSTTLTKLNSLPASPLNASADKKNISEKSENGRLQRERKAQLNEIKPFSIEFYKRYRHALTAVIRQTQVRPLRVYTTYDTSLQENQTNNSSLISTKKVSFLSEMLNVKSANESIQSPSKTKSSPLLSQSSNSKRTTRTKLSSQTKTPTVSQPISKYYGIDLVVSKSFWLTALGMNGNLLSYSTNPSGQTMDPRRHSILSDDDNIGFDYSYEKVEEGYNCDDELDYEFVNYDDDPFLVSTTMTSTFGIGDGGRIQENGLDYYSNDTEYWTKSEYLGKKMSSSYGIALSALQEDHFKYESAPVKISSADQDVNNITSPGGLSSISSSTPQSRTSFSRKEAASSMRIILETTPKVSKNMRRKGLLSDLNISPKAHEITLSPKKRSPFPRKRGSSSTTYSFDEDSKLPRKCSDDLGDEDLTQQVKTIQIIRRSRNHVILNWSQFHQSSHDNEDSGNSEEDNMVTVYKSTRRTSNGKIRVRRVALRKSRKGSK